MMIGTIGLVSAYYPGEIKVFNNTMGIDNLVYTIINNESSIEDLNITITKENITINFPGDMKPNKFDIVFIENQTKIVEIPGETIYTGGGTTTVYKDKNITVTKRVTTKGDTIYVNETVVETVTEKVNKIPIYIWFIIIILFITLLLMIISRRN